MQYILTAEVNILDGLLAGSIPFQPGLNIIGGENGTLKTRLLQEIRAGKITKVPSTNPRVQAVSPKRNSERRSIQTIVQQVRQQNRKLADLINERQIQDQAFDNYPS